MVHLSAPAHPRIHGSVANRLTETAALFRPDPPRGAFLLQQLLAENVVQGGLQLHMPEVVSASLDLVRRHPLVG